MRHTFVPPYDGSGVDHVGTYKRSLPVNLERMYENALDWEHLPFQHASSFSAIKCLDAGAWGWRAEVVSAKGDTSLLELALDRSARRWITRNLEGPSKGAEIWTHVFVTDSHALDLVIDFFVPGVPPSAREKVGMAYATAYETLYDEDVAMMTERQRRLDERINTSTRSGSLRLDTPAHLPCQLEFDGRRFVLNKLDEDWVIYPAACPHQLGPLTGELVDGQVECPWHGYRFDVRSGACTTGASCAFGPRPNVQEGADHLLLSWS